MASPEIAKGEKSLKSLESLDKKTRIPDKKKLEELKNHEEQRDMEGDPAGDRIDSDGSTDRSGHYQLHGPRPAGTLKKQ